MANLSGATQLEDWLSTFWGNPQKLGTAGGERILAYCQGTDVRMTTWQKGLLYRPVFSSICATRWLIRVVAVIISPFVSFGFSMSVYYRDFARDHYWQTSNSLRDSFTSVVCVENICFICCRCLEFCGLVNAVLKNVGLVDSRTTKI
eukprot:6047461-Amphidinium_carterae.2